MGKEKTLARLKVATLLAWALQQCPPVVQDMYLRHA